MEGINYLVPGQEFFLGLSTDILSGYPALLKQLDPSRAFPAVLGNSTEFAIARLARFLNVTGPGISISMGCPSSLISLHLACRSLQNKECELAIAGGSKLRILPLKSSMNAGIESRRGKSRAFDDDRDGAGLGEGAVSLLLKSLRRAVADRDHIHAVVKGSAMSQNGSSVKFTTPSAGAISQAITGAWEEAGIDPGTITCIEAHGTGTLLGDAIELEGIETAFGNRISSIRHCAIGSVKTNIGHLYEASGLMGVAKSILSLKHGTLFPSLHFQKGNSYFDFNEASVFVNDRLAKWETAMLPRRCGVTSYGMNGMNCHLVLEEAPSVTIEAENGRTTSYSPFRPAAAKALEGKDRLSDICYTANTGRTHYSNRKVYILQTKQELREKINLALSMEWDGLQSYGIYCGVAESNKEQPGLPMKRYHYVRLHDICTSYIQGGTINWDPLYEGFKLQKVSLPNHPFESERCWINPVGSI